MHHPRPAIPDPAIPDSQLGPQADRRRAVRLHAVKLPSRNQRKTRREIMTKYLADDHNPRCRGTESAGNSRAGASTCTCLLCLSTPSALS